MPLCLRVLKMSSAFECGHNQKLSQSHETSTRVSRQQHDSNDCFADARACAVVLPSQQSLFLQNGDSPFARHFLQPCWALPAGFDGQQAPLLHTRLSDRKRLDAVHPTRLSCLEVVTMHAVLLAVAQTFNPTLRAGYSLLRASQRPQGVNLQSKSLKCSCTDSELEVA